MLISSLKHPWEYDEIAALCWLPQEVRRAFSRFSDRSDDIVAFKYTHDGIIEGVGIGKFAHAPAGTYLVIGHLNVKEGCRNQGIGSTLLNRFLEISSYNHVTCKLQVTLSNRKARRLYGRFDFSPIPVQEDTGTLWMAKPPLSAHATA